MPLSVPAEIVWSGQGGHAIPSVPAGVAFPVAEWRLQRRARLADATTSASGGEVRALVLRGGSFTINVPWNSNLTPEAAGFVEGAELADLGLMLGDSGFMYAFPAIMENIEYVCNAANDIIRLTISGYSQGAIGAPVPVPA
jgi:hypothetical protein